MSTQMLTPLGSAEWKERYYQALKEFEEKEKTWAEEEGGLYKSILRLVFTYTGRDPGLDQQLSRMRDGLRQEGANQARKKIIAPVIDEVINFSRRQKKEAGNPGDDALAHLLKSLSLPARYMDQLDSIRRALEHADGEEEIHRVLDDLAGLMGRAARENKNETGSIELKADDPLTQLLDNLSLPGELGIEVLALRKRAGEIEEEQERLQVIQELVQVLSRQNSECVDGDGEHFPHLKKTLLELFEWLSIPEEYSTRVEQVKTRIASLKGEPDLSAALRDTAIVINDLQETLQMELGDIQDFLTRVTSRLEDVESCFRDLNSTESENREESRKLDNHIRDNVLGIRQGILESDDIGEMKQAIESRLSFIEQAAADFVQSTQTRQQVWQDRVKVLKDRLDGMKGETAKLHRRIQEEYRKAKTDALTSIPNRLAYNEKIKQEYARWQRNGRPLSVCVIDVDKFKGVNDTWGHKAGDKVLKTIAQVCDSRIRKVDFIARYGGEEFVLLLPETKLEQARLAAENLRREVEKRKFHYASEPVDITISCGVADFSEGDTPHAVFERADRALYAAKEGGRNQVQVAPR